MLIPIILLGKYFEALAKGKTSSAINKLMSLRKGSSIVVELDEDFVIQSEKEIDNSLVQVGDFIKILPGGRIPTDGVIIRGLFLKNLI